MNKLLDHLRLDIQPEKPEGTSTKFWALFGQSILLASCALLYFGVRGLTEGKIETALSNANDLLALEAWLNIDIEQSFQSWVLNSDILVSFFNWIYIWGHWPVIIGTLIWMLFRHRSEYLFLRNSILFSGALGLLIFAFYPVSPPRFLDDYKDTVTERSNSYRVLQPPALVNKYAAVPSLHFGWNLLIGVFLYRHFRSRTSLAIATTGVGLMGISIVATGNHFVLDAVAGATVALSGMAMARWRQAGYNLTNKLPHPTSY